MDFLPGSILKHTNHSTRYHDEMVQTKLIKNRNIPNDDYQAV